MPKDKSYFAGMSKTLKRHNLTWKQFKSNPELLFAVNDSFRNYVSNRFSYREPFSWYGQQTTWIEMLERHPPALTLARAHHSDWISSLDEPEDVEWNNRDIRECNYIFCYSYT